MPSEPAMTQGPPVTNCEVAKCAVYRRRGPTLLRRRACPETTSTFDSDGQLSKGNQYRLHDQ